MSNKTIYFPGLNGLRAIAAISVVISHITHALAMFNLDPTILGVNKDGGPIGSRLGEYGVSIFFALSGFLITYLLQEEKELQGIQVKKFYLRRILRIWPLYYMYLLLAVITIFMFGLEFHFNSLLFYIFYAANIPFILKTTLPFLNHYWSLGVEEQFYLFWPWVIKKLNNKLALILLLTTGFLIGTKLILHHFYLNSVIDLTFVVTRFQCMMIGGLAAILLKQKHSLFLKITDNKPAQLLCWAIILLAALNRFQIASVIDNEILSVVAVFLIIGQINIKNRIVNLENKVFDFLGKISYGIYVIHPLLIFYFSKFLNLLPVEAHYKYFFIYFIILGSTIFVAYISYRYFERYFLKLKHKYTVVKSSASDRKSVV